VHFLFLNEIRGGDLPALALVSLTGFAKFTAKIGFVRKLR